MKILLLCLSISAGLFLSGCSTADMQTLTTGGSAEKTSNIQYKATNPKSIKLFYLHEKQPKHYKLIGRVSVSNDNMIGIPHSQIDIDRKLQSEAASLGANTVININQGSESTIGDAVLIK